MIIQNTFQKMYLSELKLLLKYLVYTCKNAKTYSSLSLVNKYCNEHTKYYSPMKMKQFCKEVRFNISWLNKILYVLPNGRILKTHSSELLDPHSAEIHTREKFFDKKSDTCIEIDDYDIERVYYVTFQKFHVEYFFHNRYYSIDSDLIKIKNIVKSKGIEAQKCIFCNCYHMFMLYGFDRYRPFFFLSSYCGLNLRYYMTEHSHQVHFRRLKVVKSVIEYAKRLKMSL
jgi:hypothetical protein